MDRAIVLDSYQLSTPQPTDNSIRARAFSQEPSGESIHLKRGRLYVVIEISTNSDNKLQLETLLEQTFHKLQEKYFDLHYGGSPLEALEHAITQAQQHANQISNDVAATKIVAISIWGEMIIFGNPHQMTLGVRRNAEFFEIDETPYGIEHLKADDLLLVATENAKKILIATYLRGHAGLTNEELYTAIATEDPQQFTLNEVTLAAHFILSHIHNVPSEEEVIEIAYTEEATEPPKSTLSFIQKILGRQPKELPVQNPTIYIPEENKKSGKNKKLIAIVVIILLAASIGVTIWLNQKQQEQVAAHKQFAELQQKLERARELSQLNKPESLSLLLETEQKLGEIQGAYSEIPVDTATLYAQIDAIEKQLYSVTPIQARPVSVGEIPFPPYRVDTTGVSDTTGNIIIPSTNEWRSPQRISVYNDNIYILDSGAGQIWKYAPHGEGFVGPTPYFKTAESINSALDFAIDGSVYLLYQQRIERFFTGKQEEFTLRGTYPAFDITARITTSENNNFIFVSHPHGVLVFDKDGMYQKMLTNEAWEQVTNFMFAVDGKKLFIQSGQQWWEITP